jgi:hypothetical protein
MLLCAAEVAEAEDRPLHREPPPSPATEQAGRRRRPRPARRLRRAAHAPCSPSESFRRGGSVRRSDPFGDSIGSGGVPRPGAVHHLLAEHLHHRVPAGDGHEGAPGRTHLPSRNVHVAISAERSRVAAHGQVELLGALTDAPAYGRAARTRSIHGLRESHAGEGSSPSEALRARCRQMAVQRIHVRGVRSAEETRTWQRTTSSGSVWRT